MNKNSTPNNDPAAFIANLENAGFVPGRWDAPSCRILDYKNAAGNVAVRVAVDYEGEEAPNSVRVVAFCGTRAQITKWEATVPAVAPSTGILPLIVSAMNTSN
jgi:hypothetical protein